MKEKVTFLGESILAAARTHVGMVWIKKHRKRWMGGALHEIEAWRHFVDSFSGEANCSRVLKVVNSLEDKTSHAPGKKSPSELALQVVGVSLSLLKGKWRLT